MLRMLLLMVLASVTFLVIYMFESVAHKYLGLRFSVGLFEIKFVLTTVVFYFSFWVGSKICKYTSNSC